MALAGREIVRDLRGSQGRPCAARPSITASAPEIRRAASASSKVLISPLTTSGMEMASRTGRTALQSARPCKTGSGCARDRDHLHAGGFSAPRQFRRVDAGVVPAEPHLQRDRYGSRADRGLNQGKRMVQVAHQCRAGLLRCDVFRRATHIDVDNCAPAPSAIRAPSAIQRGSQPASWTTWKPVPCPSARNAASGLPWIRSSQAVISDTTSPAPSRVTSRRTARRDAGHRRQNHGIRDGEVAY